MPGGLGHSRDNLDTDDVVDVDEPLIDDDPRPYAPGSARAVLRYSTFRRVYLGAFLSNVGMWMQNVVLGALAYSLTGSSSFVGLVVFAQLGPMLFLASVGGLMADRLDRRRVLVGVSLSQLLLSLVLAGIVAPDHPNRTALLAVVFAIGIGQAIYGPTFAALLPQLVERRDLSGAISLNSAQMNASRVVGPVIGAFLDSLAGASTVFVVNAGSRLFVVVALLTVQLPRPLVDHAASRGLRALGDGLAIARRNPMVGRCLVIISTYSLISLPFIGQFPVLAERNLGIDERSTAYGALYACFGIGAVAGALSIGTVFSQRSKARLARFGLMAFSGALGVLALLRGPMPAYPAVAVVGFTYFALVTSLMTLLQEEVEDRVRGRVMALWIMGWAGMVPVGNLVAGPLIELTSMTTVMLVGAGFALALTAYARLEPSHLAPALPPDVAVAPCPGR
jgi:MFS family permease